MFKVVPDQLRISEGWVRCGQCGEIFNASQNLLAGEPVRTQAPAAPTPPPVAPAPPERPADPVAPHGVAQTPMAGLTMPVPPSGPAFERPADTAGAPRPQQFEQKVWDLEPAAEDPQPEPQLHGSLVQSAPPHAPETQAPPVPAFVPVEPVWAEEPPPPDAHTVTADAAPQADSPIPGAEPAPVAAAPAIPRDTEDDPHELPVSFMQQGRDTHFWGRRPVRLALVVLALLLTGLLLAQVLVQERNRLVLLEPATRPVVQALCRLAGCEIGALRQIESVVIDSSSFGRLRTDAYRLAFSLRNQAPIDIAMPAIELSLTDTQDQALIRRVILPSEYGAPGAVLAAGADWSGTLAMNIRPGAGTDRIAGYRLLAFYP